jgi:hypothetical protein
MGHAADPVSAQIEGDQPGADLRCLAGFEHGFRVIDAGDDRPLIAQRAAKSHHQTSLVGAHLKGLDVQSTPALHLPYLGRSASSSPTMKRPSVSWRIPDGSWTPVKAWKRGMWSGSMSTISGHGCPARPAVRGSG